MKCDIIELVRTADERFNILISSSAVQLYEFSFTRFHLIISTGILRIEKTKNKKQKKKTLHQYRRGHVFESRSSLIVFLFFSFSFRKLLHYAVKSAYITAMIIHLLIPSSAVQMYDSLYIHFSDESLS